MSSSRWTTITLNEAYQFAFNETFGRTVDTKGGAQHPDADWNGKKGDEVQGQKRQNTDGQTQAGKAEKVVTGQLDGSIPYGFVTAGGIVAYSDADAARIMGRRSAEIADLLGFRGRDEMIHRDDLVLMQQPRAGLPAAAPQPSA